MLNKIDVKHNVCLHLQQQNNTMKQNALLTFVMLLLCATPFTSFAQPGCIGYTADFEFADDTADLFGKTLFTNTSMWTDSATIYRWSFGDGDTVYTKVPNHSYIKQGNYNVCLLAVNLKLNGDTVCRDTACKQVTVNFDTCVASAVNLLYSVSHPDSCLKYNFITNTVGLHLNYLWDFGDGNTDTVGHTRNTFPSAGKYNVCLAVYYLYDNNLVCADTACDTLNVCASLGTYSPSTATISIYPNPVTDMLVIETAETEALQITIADVAGREQLSQTVHGTKAIQVAELSNGMYYITVSKGDTVLLRQKMLK